MTNQTEASEPSVGAWAKRFHFAARAAMESVLRPYDLGPTQWYVLYQLVNGGPTRQRDLGQMLKLERATLSGIVATLVRKGLLDQSADAADQRQRILRITPEGRKLWEELPDPVGIATRIAFEGVDQAELAITARVLRSATQRLSEHLPGTGQ